MSVYIIYLYKLINELSIYIYIYIISKFCIAGLPLYDVNKDFTCLDGSKVIRFSSVNDDYCDCTDGSDEPGWFSVSYC